MSLKPVTKISLNEAENLYLSAAKARASGSSWLDSLREAAVKEFEAQGLPHRRVEAWKYTDVRAFDRAGFAPAEPAEEASAPAPFMADADEIIIRNGFVEESSLQPERFEGFQVMSLRTALIEVPEILERAIGEARPLERSSLYALNLSLMNDGLVLIADAGVSHPRPIVIRYVYEGTQPGSAHVRNVIVAGQAAQFTLVECREASVAPNFLNAVTNIEIAAKADVKHYKFDQCSNESLTVLLASAQLGIEARYENIGLSTGGKAARIETQVRFSGEGGYARLGGVLAGQGRDHIDHTTLVRHDVPKCSCDEEFRAILGDQAQGVFQGKISVAPDAQKTDARMLMRGLLLSDNASLRGKPELEIYADDVKCAHGTSIGALDEEALFYMMSRGIPEKQARALLVEAFSKDVVESITHQGVREVFSFRLTHRLAQIVTASSQEGGPS